MTLINVAVFLKIQFISLYSDYVEQGCRNVTQKRTSILSRVKTNLSTMDFYADLCFPRPGEPFSVENCV